MKHKDFETMINSIQRIHEAKESPEMKLLEACQLLANQFHHYDWVGIYYADDAAKMLTLGPFVGEPTDHVIIPFGKGICGQAAETKETFVIDDVSSESNYLACSLKVRSEIVIPLFFGDRIVGELDIDSHSPAAFSENDRQFLEAISPILAIWCNQVLHR